MAKVKINHNINMEKRRIGIITFHCAINYGGVLQVYALSKTLLSLGYNVKIINLRPPNISKDNPKRITDFLFRWLFNKFTKKHLPPLTKIIKDNSELKDLNKQFDIFIAGSDQIWNPELSRNYLSNYLLDFVEDNKTKIAYAASFGVDRLELDDSELSKIKRLLESFNLLTVREESAKTICKDTFKVDSTIVVDPTLLLNDYSELTQNKNNKEKGIVCVKFIKSQEFVKIAQYLGEKLNSNVYLINSPKRFKGIKSVYLPKVSTWLNLIKNAELVVTDSFHGLCFSLLFNKNFIVVPGKIGRFTRLENLLKALGLEDRIYMNLSDLKDSNILENPINYEKVNEKLLKLRDNSMTTLLKGLNTKS